MILIEIEETTDLRRPFRVVTTVPLQSFQRESREQGRVLGRRVQPSRKKRALFPRISESRGVSGGEPGISGPDIFQTRLPDKLKPEPEPDGFFKPEPDIHFKPETRPETRKRSQNPITRPDTRHARFSGRLNGMNVDAINLMRF